MSEKRFTIHKESKYKEEWYAYPFCIKEDGELVLETIPLSIAEKVRDKLNEQQATINELQRIINHIKCEENCEDYDYCCETVCSLYNEIKHLKEENEQLRNIIKQKEKEEKLYAKEILRLNELNKQTSEFTDILGGY